MKRPQKAEAELHPPASAKPLTPPPTAVAVLGAEQIRALMYDAAADAFRDVLADANRNEPVWYSGGALAEKLGVSRVTVHRWRKLGMPAIAVGDTGYKYLLPECVAWHRAGGARRER